MRTKKSSDGMALDLDQRQVKQLLRGKGIQLKPHQIGKGHPLPSDFPMRQRKALHRAMKAQRGMRLNFSPEEIQGTGFLDWLKSLGNMIIKPAKALAPVLKPVAKAIAPIVSAKTGIPTDILTSGVDVVGNLAGVGIMRGRGRVQRLADDSSTMMKPVHPVMGFQPQFTGHDVRRTIQASQGGALCVDPKKLKNNFIEAQQGGSFRAAGY